RAMKNHLFGLISLLFLSAAASAQPARGSGQMMPTATITGTVFDLDLGTPVEYANVVVHGLRDTALVNGTVTRADGRFELSGLRPGRYKVEVSFIGYRTHVIPEVQLAPGATKDLGRINLRQTVVAVEGTEVTAERPRLEFKIDKKVINVAQNPAVQSGTAVDALENAPGVKVDVENNVTLRGSANFTVLIDGRPSLLEPSEALQQIPASTIESIEIITNPSAKYDPEGVSGIVNVVLKKQRQRGVSGMANLTAGLDDKYGGDLLVTMRRGIASAFVGANFNRMNFPGTRTVESWTRSGDTIRHVNSDGTGAFGFRFYGLRAGTDLQLGANDRLSLGGRWGGRGGGQSQQAGYKEWREPGTDTTFYSGRSNSGRGGNNLSANLDHTHTFGRQGHDLALRLDYNRHDRISDDTTEMRDTAGLITTGRRTFEGGPRNRLGAKLEYTLPLRVEDKLEAGYQGQSSWSQDIYRTFEYDTASRSYPDSATFSLVSDFRYGVHALYTTWSASFGRLGIQPGVRLERTARSISTPDSVFTLNQWDFFPTAHLSYKLPHELQLMASYTRRIDRPRGWDLEPSERWLDAYNVMKGNPGLKNEYIDAIEGGFLWPFGANRVSIEAYHRITHNLVDRVSSLYPGRPGVMLRTVENVGTDRSTGAEATFDMTPFPWWSVNLEGDVYDYHVQGEVFGQPFSRSSFNWSVGGSFDFRFPTMTLVQLRANYSSPTVGAQGNSGSTFSTSIALRQAFFNRSLLINLQVRDLLSSGGHEMTTEGENFYTHANFARKTPIVTLGLTWTFNNYRPDRRQLPDMQMEDTGPENGGF
ncbi:MAG: TonB-dependent receptor, partial [candidate division WOR-3 bacterium]